MAAAAIVAVTPIIATSEGRMSGPVTGHPRSFSSIAEARGGRDPAIARNPRRMLKSPRHRLDIGRSRFGMGQTPAKIALLGGDGIGPEVIGQARRLLEALAQARGIAIEIAEEPYGLDCFKQHGVLLREETLAAMRSADAVLFGATGGLAYAELPEKIRKAGNLLAIRKALGLYANLRPVFAIPALAEAS